MSLYVDIMTSYTPGDEDIKFDEETKTWTVEPWELDGRNLPGIPDKEMALAIVRVIRVAYDKGVEAAGYS